MALAGHRARQVGSRRGPLRDGRHTLLLCSLLLSRRGRHLPRHRGAGAAVEADAPPARLLCGRLRRRLASAHPGQAERPCIRRSLLCRRRRDNRYGRGLRQVGALRQCLHSDAEHSEQRCSPQGSEGAVQGARLPLPPNGGTIMFALPLQLVVQAPHLLILSRSRDGPSSAEGLLTYINSTMIATPTNPRSDVMKMASTLLLPPFLFAGYQLCSIYVLSLVHPLAHVLVNTTWRGVIIGLGAYFTGEDITLRYMFGAATTLIGMSAFSLSKMKGFSPHAGFMARTASAVHHESEGCAGACRGIQGLARGSRPVLTW
mmetsp:Transcript_9019/g.15349  ORF Transcript_9019/g.15349 Transcript_9019/m.15349 type:complete len:316 (+) Transcript_9019:910-1857(+)